MSFFSRLFKGGRGAPASANNNRTQLQRSATAQQPRSSEEDSDGPGPLSEPIVYRRTVMGSDNPTYRRHGGELRRSQTFNESSNCKLHPSRSSTSSSESTSLDDILRKHYRHIRLCHRGRLASILEGTDRNTRRPVVIKAFAKAGMSVLKREKMEREVALLKAASECSGVVKMLNVVEDQHHHYTVLEAVPGYTLIEAMANSGGRLPEARCAIEVVLPLLRTLAALHKIGIVHRDLKPEHIICTYGSIKLVDFCEAAQRQTQCLNHKAGQLEYMAPEVLDKPLAEDIFHKVLHAGMSEEELPQYDEKADIWSAGAVIYEALTGMQPFPAECAAEMQRLHTERLGGPCDAAGVPLWLRGCTQLSPGAQEFLAQMLCLSPGKRLSAEQCLHHPWLHKHIRSSASQWLLPPEPVSLPAANNVVPLSPSHALSGRISDEVSSTTTPAPVTQQLTGLSEPRQSSIEVIVSSAPKKVAVR